MVPTGMKLYSLNLNLLPSVARLHHLMQLSKHQGEINVDAPPELAVKFKRKIGRAQHSGCMHAAGKVRSSKHVGHPMRADT